MPITTSAVNNQPICSFWARLILLGASADARSRVGDGCAVVSACPRPTSAHSAEHNLPSARRRAGIERDLRSIGERRTEQSEQRQHGENHGNRTFTPHGRYLPADQLTLIGGCS
jgi:hypothetical protein